MRVSLWSLWLVLSAVAGIAESDSSSLRQQVNHRQIRLLQDDPTGGSGREVPVLGATDAPGSIHNLDTEAPIDTPVPTDETPAEAPAETPSEGNTLTEAPTEGSTLTAAPTGDGTIEEAPIEGNTLNEAPTGDGTIEEAPTDDTEVLVPAGSPVPSTGFDSEAVTPAPSPEETPTDEAPAYGSEVMTPAPSPEETPTDEAPTYGSEIVTPAPSPEEIPTDEVPTDEVPTYVSEVVTPAPSPGKTPTYEAPTHKAPTEEYSTPTEPSYAYPTPTVPASGNELPTEEEYVPLDDDPIQNEDTEEEEEEWADNLTLEEMEKDRNVLIALSTVAGLGFLLMIITAHQMLENPDGCCASVCRITVACFCAIFRLVCFPCRMICGCTNRYGRTSGHELMQNNFSHDLELS